MADINLKYVGNINFNSNKVDCIILDNTLVWPEEMSVPQITSTSMNSALKTISYTIYNPNSFAVSLQHCFNTYIPSLNKWESDGSISAKSSKTVSLDFAIGLNPRLFRFLYRGAQSKNTSNTLFVAHINYERDSNILGFTKSVSYVITTKQETFEVTASLKDNAYIESWELSSGLKQISKSGNSITVQVISQTSDKELYIKATSAIRETCSTCSTQLSLPQTCSQCGTNISNVGCPTCSTSLSSNVCNNLCTTSNSTSICGSTCGSSLSSCKSCSGNMSAPCLTCTTNASACVICTTSSSKSICTTIVSSGGGGPCTSIISKGGLKGNDDIFEESEEIYDL